MPTTSGLLPADVPGQPAARARPRPSNDKPQRPPPRRPPGAQILSDTAGFGFGSLGDALKLPPGLSIGKLMRDVIIKRSGFVAKIVRRRLWVLGPERAGRGGPLC